MGDAGVRTVDVPIYVTKKHACRLVCLSIHTCADYWRKGRELHGCFSPSGTIHRLCMPLYPVLPTIDGESIVVLVAPVLRIMHEFRELFLGPTSLLSVEHSEADSLMTFFLMKLLDDLVWVM